MKEKTTEPLGEGADDALGAAVLLRRVGAREVESDAVRGEERAEGGIVKFTAVISVERDNGALKLGGNIGMEGDQELKHVRLAAHRERPCKVSVVIE